MKKGVSLLINKRRIIIAGLAAVILLIAIMVVTTPAKEEFDKWLLEENGIVCDQNGWDRVCTKDNQLIRSSSSHFRNVGIFASYERDFEFEGGKQVTYRTLGIFGQLFVMKGGPVWEILN
jgi:hypothetical protein